MSEKSVISNFSNGTFLILYPISFIYYFLVSAGYIEDYSFMNHLVKALFLVYSLLFIKEHLKLISGSEYYLIILIFLIYMGIWTLVSLVAGVAPPGTVRQSLSAVMSLFVVLSVAAFMDAGRKYVKASLFAASAIITLIVFTYSQNYKFVPAEIFDAESDSPTYQVFSMLATVTFIFTVSMLRVWYIRFVAYLVFLLGIFMLSARSELAGFVISAILVEFISAMRFRITTVVIVFVAMSFAIIVYLNMDRLLSALSEYVGVYRQANILDLSMDSSWSARKEYTDYSWGLIKDSIVAGNFGGYYYADFPPGIGTYAHNAISAWVNYGIFGFIIYMSISIWAFIHSMYMYLKIKSAGNRISLFINCFTLLLIIFAKPVFWPLAALGWGLYARQQVMYRRHRHTNRRHEDAYLREAS